MQFDVVLPIKMRKLETKKSMNHQKSEAFFSFRGIRGAFQQMFTFVIGISCGNTPFVQKHESTTHVNGYSFRLSYESTSTGVLFQNTSFVRFTYSPWLQAEACVSKEGRGHRRGKTSNFRTVFPYWKNFIRA